MSRHKLDPKLSRLLDPGINNNKPQEDLPLCPFCHSIDVEIEEWIKHYPYFRCIQCHAGFYKLEQRAACSYYKVSVGKNYCPNQCPNYRPLNPITNPQCQDWKGPLTIPSNLMTLLKRENRKEDLINKGSFNARRIA